MKVFLGTSTPRKINIKGRAIPCKNKAALLDGSGTEKYNLTFRRLGIPVMYEMPLHVNNWLLGKWKLELEISPVLYCEWMRQWIRLRLSDTFLLHSRHAAVFSQLAIIRLWWNRFGNGKCRKARNMLRGVGRPAVTWEGLFCWRMIKTWRGRDFRSLTGIQYLCKTIIVLPIVWNNKNLGFCLTNTFKIYFLLYILFSYS